jgi:hypothetical protein
LSRQRERQFARRIELHQLSRLSPQRVRPDAHERGGEAVAAKIAARVSFEFDVKYGIRVTAKLKKDGDFSGCSGPPVKCV